MRRAVRLGLALSLAMVGMGVQAMESNAPCVQIYAHEQEQVEHALSAIDQVVLTRAGVAVLSVGGLKVCAVGSLPVIGGCAAILGVVNFGLYGYHNSLINRLARHEGQSLLYQIYRSYVEGRKDAPEIKAAMEQARIDLQKEDQALRILVQDMESGRLCSRGYARVDFADWVQNLKTNLL